MKANSEAGARVLTFLLWLAHVVALVLVWQGAMMIGFGLGWRFPDGIEPATVSVWLGVAALLVPTIAMLVLRVRVVYVPAPAKRTESFAQARGGMKVRILGRD